MLVAALREGSLKAFDIIYARYFDIMYRYCRKGMSCDKDAEDFVQDVFANLWYYHNRIDPEMSLSKLLYTIAIRYRANAFRKLVNSPVYVDFMEARDDVAEATGERIDYIGFRKALTAAVKRLPANQREAIELSYFNDMDNESIAKKLSLSNKTVRNLLTLGRKQLRTHLREFITSMILAHLFIS